MANLRFMLIMVAITLGLSFFGCSRSAGPKATQSATERNGRTLAEESGQAGPHKQWWHDESITTELELTDDQVQAIDDLMIVSSGDATVQRQQERRLSLRYLRALNQEPYDAALADKLGQRLTETMSSEHQRRIENVRALRDILTLEQWTKLWEVAPRVVQVGRFRVLLGPTISVSDDPNPPPTPTP